MLFWVYDGGFGSFFGLPWVHFGTFVWAYFGYMKVTMVSLGHFTITWGSLWKHVGIIFNIVE